MRQRFWRLLSRMSLFRPARHNATRFTIPHIKFIAESLRQRSSVHPTQTNRQDAKYIQFILFENPVKFMSCQICISNNGRNRGENCMPLLIFMYIHTFFFLVELAIRYSWYSRVHSFEKPASTNERSTFNLYNQCNHPMLASSCNTSSTGPNIKIV